MTIKKSFRDQLEKILQDKDHGASYLQQSIVQFLQEILLTKKKQHKTIDLNQLEEISEFIKHRRPDLPSLYNLTKYFIHYLQSHTPERQQITEELIHSAIKELQDLNKKLVTNFIQAYVKLNQQQKIHTIITLSHSSTISMILRELHHELKESNIQLPELVILESRPRFEGVLLALELQDYFRVHVITDAMCSSWIRKDPIHTLGLFGADAILKDGVINKIGTMMIAVLLKTFNGHNMVVSSMLKSVKDTMKTSRIEEQSPEEVTQAWKEIYQLQSCSMNFQVHNKYFERITFEFIDVLVTEEIIEEIA